MSSMPEAPLAAHVPAALHPSAGLLGRRLAFGAACGIAAALLLGLGVATLGADGWSGLDVALFALLVAASPWPILCAANAAIGFVLLLGSKDPLKAVFPIAAQTRSAPRPIRSRSAILVAVRSEDPHAVLARVRALLDGLDRAGEGSRFGAFIASDTQDPAQVAIEDPVYLQAAASDPRIRYRRREQNTGFKAGNVMDFVDHHATGFEHMLVLDADSTMGAEAVLRLVRILEADPEIGLVQGLIVGRPASAAFARLFQFGMRHGMRTWAMAIAWWQGDDGPFWGHNALIRIQAFRDDARLPLLPGGRHILSHDQVEAVLLRAAGWKVRLYPLEDDSTEANPPGFVEFARRDVRWLAGNLQYLDLLRLPGIRAMGRFQLLQAILMFATAPALALLLPLGLIAGLSAAPVAGQAESAMALVALFMAMQFSPKLLGAAEVLLRRDLRTAWGGGARVALGTAAEFLASLVITQVSIEVHATGIAGLLLGRKIGWAPQRREDHRLGWGDALRAFLVPTLVGIVALALAALSGGAAFWITLLAAGGLVLAAPFAVLTTDPRLSAWMVRVGLCAVPEERSGRG